MRKITLFIVGLFATALCINAQVQLNNPKDAEGFYIVKWDCQNETWAASNDFEVDETFTFAVDVTGTPYEDMLKSAPSVAGATRSLAINRWTGFGDLNGNTNRLKQIKGNIYGATWNIIQLGTTLNVADATTAGAETFVAGQIFGYEYNAETPGAAWWQWPDGIAVGTNVDPGTGNIFKTAPYTGTKTSSVFYNDDFGNELFGKDYPEKGYAPACAVIGTGIEQVQKDAADVVKVEFYNLQGMKLNAEPETGLYIKTSILSDGSSLNEKLIKVQQ